MSATMMLMMITGFIGADGASVSASPVDAGTVAGVVADPCDSACDPCATAGKAKVVRCKPARATVCEAPARATVCEAPTRIVVHQSEPIVEFRRSAPKVDAAVAPCGHGFLGHGGGACNSCGGGANGCGAGGKHVNKKINWCGGGFPMLPQAAGMPMAAAPQMMAVPTTVTAFATVPVQVPSYSYQQVAAFQPAAYGAYGFQAASDDGLLRLASAIAALEERSNRSSATANTATANAASADLSNRVAKLEGDVNDLKERVARIERKIASLCNTP
jgi:hypothetical protein